MLRAFIKSLITKGAEETSYAFESHNSPEELQKLYEEIFEKANTLESLFSIEIILPSLNRNKESQAIYLHYGEDPYALFFYKNGQLKYNRI